MKRSAAYAAIRQIATLGYSGKMALPAILDALGDIVPHEKANFAWVDEECNGIDWVGPLVVPPEVMQFYLEQYHNRREASEIPSNRQLMDSLGTDRSASLEGFRRSDFFNIIFRAGGNGHFLRLAVRDGARPLGIFYLLRPIGGADFTAAEERHFAQAAAWIAHALAAPERTSAQEKWGDAEGGLIVVDPKGGILFLSAGARELLHRAAGVCLTHATLSDHCFHWARPLIGRLMDSLSATRHKTPAPGVPAVTIRNAAGCFVLRAYWIDSAAPGGSRNAAIQIQRQIPLPLRLMQSPRLRKLPPREQQACLLLARGQSASEIAKHMGISRDGAVYHIRSTYNNLGISCREELVGALLGQDA